MDFTRKMLDALLGFSLGVTIADIHSLASAPSSNDNIPDNAITDTDEIQDDASYLNRLIPFYY